MVNRNIIFYVGFVVLVILVFVCLFMDWVSSGLFMVSVLFLIVIHLLFRYFVRR